MSRRSFREKYSKFQGTKQVLQDLNAPAHSATHDLDPITTGVPSGGTTDQVLSKNSGSDYDLYWQTVGITTNLDGGAATTSYGGTTAITGGGA